MTSLKKKLKAIKEKLTQLDNERLAIAAVSLLGLGLLLPLLIVAPGLLESEWFLTILTVLAEYASFIAGGAYIGRLLNLFTARSFKTGTQKEKTKVTTLLNKEVVMTRRIGVQEKELTSVGMLLGMGLAIACIALHIILPFFNVFSYFTYLIFTLGYACAVGGLFNRLGSSMDGTRLSQEKKAILFGAIFGLAVALSLVAVLAATGTLPLVAVGGISKVFFDLFVLHKTLFTLIFIFSITSLTTSFFDYFTKAYCFLKYSFRSKDALLIERLASRYHEYRGAFLGLAAGCLLTIGIVTGLALTGGLAAAPPLALAATLFITTITCNSVISALFSRIGRVIDGLKRPSSTKIIEEKDKDPTVVVSINNGYVQEMKKTTFTPLLGRSHSCSSFFQKKEDKTENPVIVAGKSQSIFNLPRK